MCADALRYHTIVDLTDENSSLTQLILLTGEGKKVLEIGPATGYVTEALCARGCRVTAIEKDAAAAEAASRFCERMIVGDVEDLDLEAAFGDERFDAIMLGDVLEHLVEPEETLRRLRRLVADDGCVVASIPNIAHASVRLMLLDGRFGYTERGLLDETHLRFFTRDGVESLFRQAGYHIRLWRRTTTPTLDDPLGEGLAPKEAELPPYLVRALRDDREATTYQFVVRAHPMRRASSRTRAASDSRNGIRATLQALWGTERLLSEKDRQVEEARHAIAERDSKLALKDREIARKDTHIANIETALHNANLQLNTASQQLQEITASTGYRLLERARRPIRWLAPEGSRRRFPFLVASRALNLLASRGPVALVRRAVQVGEWLPNLRGARREAAAPTLDEQYQLWLQANALTPTRAQEMRQQATRIAYRPLVSIVVPVYNPEPDWLSEAIASVRSQLYDNWELCMADDGSTKPGVHDALRQAAEADPRVKVTYLEKNGGISAASNAALALASGEFVGLLDHDDELKPDALLEVVKLLNENRELDYVYTDEDKKEPDGRLVEPFFKPDWSPDLEMSINYVTHFSVFRRELIKRAGGFRPQCDGSQDYDLVLRVTELTDRIAHVPLPLYTWRKVPGSAAANAGAKGYAFKAAQKALGDALARRSNDGDVEDGLWKGSYRVRYRIAGNPKVSIIIPTRDRVDMLRQCIQSINRRSTYRNYEIIVVDNESRQPETLEYLASLDGRVISYPHPFDFADIINTAAREADGEFLLILNNDTEVISPDWIEAMLEQAQRPEVGAVGARLLYPDGRVQHEGIIMGLGTGSALNVDHGGYFGLGECIKNCTAVTGACMMVRASRFQELGGFEGRLRVAFNDVDFCLRAREKGYRIVYTPFAALYHHESASRGSLHPDEDERFFRRRWGKPGTYRDPYYNPNLDLRRPFNIRV